MVGFGCISDDVGQFTDNRRRTENVLCGGKEMIKFKDKLFDDEEVVLEECDIKSIDQADNGLFYIENVDGLVFACDEYVEVKS